ncbi:MAG: DUF4160 domain-containing protein [Dehalococcoidia bacterium]|nr:DUF4160 domain-containing protein [Dehalococcoidia bacterium]MCA9843699.1 DUF4160 domain-containing protein [Dehalococcoidia bacterium]MCA9854353.1 DUF4160 domain-containing protein [Dehalococcoidia bacterium]
MPTVLRSGPYRLYFVSHEPNEPPYVHVDRDRRTAKYWLDNVRLASYQGFADHELRQIERIVRENAVAIRRGWYEFFGA